LPPLYEKDVDLPNQINSINKKFKAIELKGYTAEKTKKYPIKDYNYKILPLSLYWKCLNKTEFDYQIKIHFTSKNSSFEENYPLSALYPTHDWEKSEIIKVNYQFLIPEEFENSKYQIALSVYRAQGNMGLNKSKIFRPQIRQIDKFGKVNLLEVNPH